MKITSIMGMDVSKATLDLHLHLQNKSLSVANSQKGFEQMSRWLNKELKDTSDLLVVMEYTGIYTYNVERFLESKSLAYVKRSALDILRSLGIKRGKSDRADAKFISRYGWMRKDELKPMKPVSDKLVDLQQLMSYRDKLVADRASYQARIKELKDQMKTALNQKIETSSKWMIDSLKQQIAEIEAEISKVIQCDEKLARNYELITSVRGVGFVTAVHFLVTTENFTRFTDVRKMLCYSGLAPFEHSSGTSIRGKTQTSHLANKKLKSLLTMAAISAIQHDPELKLKYEQKVREGKPKMSALNIIRVKLVERIFAVIRKQEMYQLKIAA
jgi:transposase